MKTSKKYTKELNQQFGYLATWLPGTPLALGDIGILKRNEYTKISNLSDLGISFEILEDKTKSDIEHSSKGAVSISTKASGTIAPQGSALGNTDAGVTVEFTKENAVFFKANGTISPSIKNQILLGQEILKMYKEGKWDKDWVVITELIKADSATILISSSAKGKIELKAKGKLETLKIDIADAKIGFELSYSKDLSTKIIAEEALTPLFKACKIKSRLVLPPVIRINKINSMDLMTPDKAKTNKDLIYFDEVEYENIDEEE